MWIYETPISTARGVGMVARWAAPACHGGDLTAVLVAQLSDSSKCRCVRAHVMTQQQLLARLSAILLILWLMGGAIVHAQGSQVSIQTIEQRIAELQVASREGGSSMRLARNGREILDDIVRSDFSAADRLRRMQQITEMVLVLPMTSRNGERRDLVLREKRNTALYLLGSPLSEIGEHADYDQLRQQVAESLVSFVARIKGDQSSNFRPTPVQLNMPLDGQDTEAARAEKNRQFQAENHRINDENKYQMALNEELKFLTPRIASFLRESFGASPEDQARLQQYLRRL